jgi:MerR family regulatory protein
MAQGIQIGRVAELTGLSIDTIRFYQKIGLVKQPARSEGGFRLFTDEEMKDLVFIKKAQARLLPDPNQAVIHPQSRERSRMFSGARPA